jgi:hypothetical protein
MENNMPGKKQHRRTHKTTKLIKKDTFHSGKARRNREDESRNRAPADTHCLQQRGSKHALSSAMCMRWRDLTYVSVCAQWNRQRQRRTSLPVSSCLCPRARPRSSLPAPLQTFSVETHFEYLRIAPLQFELPRNVAKYSVA